MSVTVMFEPTHIAARTLHGQSTFLECLRQITGEHEGSVFLDTSHIGKLQGLAIAEKAYRDDVAVLVASILEHGEVRVWGEW